MGTGGGKYKGKTFAFAGKLKFWNADLVQGLIKLAGGKLTKDIRATLDYLVIGQTRGTGTSIAEKKARNLNLNKGASIQILDESGFFQLWSPTREEALAMLRGGSAGIAHWNELRQLPIPMPDLSGADLHQAHLEGAFLEGVKFDGADLHGASLRKATVFFLQANLDKACLAEAHIEAISASSVRDADLNGAFLVKADRADFSRARLQEVKGEHLDGAGANFHAADLTGARLFWANLPQTDFSDAVLDKANLGESDLTGANCRNARFMGADLGKAKLERADLTGADLQDVNLTDADLTQAILHGANLAGASLLGTKLEGVDLATVKGLENAIVKPKGAVGPHLDELDKVGQQAEKLQTIARVRLPHQEVVLTAHTNSGEPYGQDSTGYWKPWTNAYLSEAILDLSRRWTRGELLLDSIGVKASKGPLNSRDMKILAVRAWCEAFGADFPAEESLKAMKYTARRAAPRKIRSGPKKSQRNKSKKFKPGKHKR